MRFRRALIAMFVLAAALLLRADAPSSLVGMHFRYVEGNTASIISFLANNEFRITQTNVLVERGYFTPRRNGDIWTVGATRWNGTITWIYTFNFQNSNSGTVSITAAGLGARTASFQQSDGIEPPPVEPPVEPPVVTNHAPASFQSIYFTNAVSKLGTGSWYRVDFSPGTSGAFYIQKPGYGMGSFVYTSGVNTGRLTLTYTGDLTGDRDDLALQFNGPSGSTTLSTHAGIQLISAREEEVRGVFTFGPTPTPTNTTTTAAARP